MMKLLLSSGTVLLATSIISGGAATSRVPVLVELFTSEGCSSCPPADRLLSRVDKEQFVPGADVVVLSEHVDYWNQLGWTDPFSSAQYSARQREYASRLNGEVYTPEMVVDGAHGFVGSDERELRNVLRVASSAPKSSLAISAAAAGDEVKITVRGAAAKGTLYVALAMDTTESQVTRGENSGKRLGHVAVVYAIRELGKMDGKSEIDREATMKTKPGSRLVAFVTGAKGVVAIAQARL